MSGAGSGAGGDHLARRSELSASRSGMPELHDVLIVEDENFDAERLRATLRVIFGYSLEVRRGIEGSNPALIKDVSAQGALGADCETTLLLDGLDELVAQMSSRWLPWLAKACLAAGCAFGLGMLTLGLPGAFFVELAQGLGRKVPPDGAWPLAIEVTAMGSLLIVPASLVLRLARPNLAGWGHAGATAAIAFVATALFTAYASSDRSPAAQQGPEMLASFVAFDITLEEPRITVGSGQHRFTLHFAAGSARGVLLFGSPGDIDGMVAVRGAQSGQEQELQTRRVPLRLPRPQEGRPRPAGLGRCWVHRRRCLGALGLLARTETGWNSEAASCSCRTRCCTCPAGRFRDD